MAYSTPNWRKPAVFFKKYLFKEWMKKFVALLVKKKRLRMNGKLMTDFLQVLFSIYKKIRICFPYSLINLLKERYISSVKSCKYLDKLTSCQHVKYKNNGLNFFLKKICICIQSLSWSLRKMKTHWTPLHA